MNKIIFYLVPLMFVFSCQRFDSQRPEKSKSNTFYSQIESFTPSTKTFIDPDYRLFWSADDRISIFESTYNQEYRFQGETGDNNGSFAKVSKEGEYVTGEDVDTNYSIFPYSVDNKINTDGRISFILPSSQTFMPGSFGPKNNIMVAATKDKDSNLLLFKNVCGFLTISVYGEGLIKSMTLKGNSNEKIAGQASVIPAFGESPSIQMDDTSSSSLTIECPGGILLNNSKDECAEFWFCIPPTIFSNGITISMSDYDGNIYEKTATAKIEINRNSVSHMEPIEASGLVASPAIHFEDKYFETYCLKNFDLDNDGKITSNEALLIRDIDYSTSSDTISLRPLAQFVNLESLSIKYESASDLSRNSQCYFDISQNIYLSRLKLENIYLSYSCSLNISRNTLLSQIDLTNVDIYGIALNKNQVVKYCNGVLCNTIEEMIAQLGIREVIYESGNSGNIESISWGNEID